MEAEADRNDTPSLETTIQLARRFDAPVKKVADWFVNYKYRKGSKAKERLTPQDDVSTRDGSAEVQDDTPKRFARLNKDQVRVLEQELLNGDSPSRAVRERLSMELDAPVQKVSEWFSNRKQRMKKRNLEESMVAGLNKDSVGAESRGSTEHHSVEENNEGSVVWKPSGRPAQPDRPPSTSPVPQLLDSNKATLRKMLRDIEISLNGLEELKQGLVMDLEENQVVHIGRTNHKAFIDIHAEVAKMERLKQQLLSVL